MNSAYYLYKQYDKDRKLLYVGISRNIRTRTITHRRDSHWFDEITRVYMQTFPDKKTAENAESLSIRKDRPMHNSKLRAVHTIHKGPSYLLWQYIVKKLIASGMEPEKIGRLVYPQVKDNERLICNIEKGVSCRDPNCTAQDTLKRLYEEHIGEVPAHHYARLSKTHPGGQTLILDPEIIAELESKLPRDGDGDLKK